MKLQNLRLGCNDLDKARAFYDATFGARGTAGLPVPSLGGDAAGFLRVGGLARATGGFAAIPIAFSTLAAVGAMLFRGGKWKLQRV